MRPLRLTLSFLFASAALALCIACLISPLTL